MKRLTVIAVLAIMILSVLLLSGCGQDEICHTVSFDADGGTPVPASQSVLDGKKVTKPTDPVKPGYIFDGWFVGDEEWSFVGYVVTDDMTIKAKWVECINHSYDEKTEVCEICGAAMPRYTVTFDVDGGSPTINIQNVLLGKVINTTGVPKKVGFIFGGWLVGDEEWNIESDVVTADITLKAVWVKCDDHVDDDGNNLCEKCGATATYSVIFDTTGGTPEQWKTIVIKGKKITEPDVPIRNGYAFDGWYNGDVKWNFAEYAVYEDITLRARWKSCSRHVDNNGDYVCDNCHTVNPDEGFVIDYPWDKQTLIFQFTENDNNRELSSGCHRYLAGDDTIYTKAIDTSIDQRNARAKIATKIDITYLYWDNTATYGFGKCIDQIEQIVNSKTAKNAPDVYVNFMYDMVGSAVKGYFANLKGTSRGTGKLAGLNYFEFNNADYDESIDNRGYMNDWMNSLTLSQHKMYVLGSDYFTDIVRAEFVIPVGVDLLEKYGEDITGDRNKDGEFTIDDFYAQVYAGEWTYDLLMEYADAVKIDDGNKNTTKCWIGDKQVGFAINSGGLAASGLLYTTNIVIIEKQWNYDRNDWDYFYPDDNEALGEFNKAVQELLAAPGVAYVKPTTSGDYNISQWGGTGSGNHIFAIRTRFSTGNVLFGDIMLVGALEYEEYQSMREGSGFGVVVVPLYDKDAGFKKNAPYLTQIHNMARPGAIAKNTTKFVECTAYLNYQSTNSTAILNEYYNYELMYNIAGGAQGTVKMLQYVRENVRTSFDNATEDAIGVFGGQAAYDIKVLPMLTRGSWGVEDIRGQYKSVLEQKRGYLEDLISWFKSASD